MNSENKSAIVLGGISNHIPLIKKLNDRGYHTILIDYLDNPPAKIYADEHIKVSTFDFKSIQEIAVERKAELIINCCLEHLNKGICKIAENIGLTAPYSYDIAISISDKEIMKSKMIHGQIPTTKFFCVSRPEDIDILNLEYPVFVKPAEGSGSNAVTHAFSKSEAVEAISKAIEKYPKSKVIIEEEALGKEYNVYCFPKNGKANVLMITRRYTDNDSEDHVTKCIGTLGPAILPQDIIDRINEIADKIVSEFKLDNVPMFIQMMVNGDEMNVIEFAGRMAGGFSDRAILETTGFDLYEATINSFLGIPNNVDFHKPDSFITVSGVYARDCIFDRVSGYETLLEEKVLVDIMITRQPGTKISESSSNGSKVAFVIMKADSIDNLVDNILRVFESIDVIDINGDSKIKRKLRITKEMIEG
ncbi:MAG: ATP-grasp domain-containing protein [Lachnospiraceae bacterium]|nr:ATP-grasp domain-containing protein [Lachnospiraceae bacterium]